MSDKLWQEQLLYTPTGCQTLSKMPCRFVEGVYPKMLVRGSGGHVYDPSGTEYLDMIAALGAISLGYSNELVNNRVVAQVQKGVSFSLANPLEAEVAKELCRLVPFTEMWKYGKNGVDATLMAVRAARALSGKSVILVSGYHGCSDIFESLGTRKAGMLDTSSTTLPWDSYKNTSIGKNAACLITEPDTTDLKEAEKWCRDNGVCLIVDEVITGGRTEGFTYCNKYGVRPDFITLSKGIANGFPLSAVGGKRSLMQVFERSDMFASTTFGGECVSLAACLATIGQLEHLLPEMVRKGTQVQTVFNSSFADKARCESYPTRLIFKWPTPEHKALFMQEMCKNRILTGYSNFIMAEHSQDDIDFICNAIENVAFTLKTHWHNPRAILNGSIPAEVVRR